MLKSEFEWTHVLQFVLSIFCILRVSPIEIFCWKKGDGVTSLRRIISLKKLSEALAIWVLHCMPLNCRQTDSTNTHFHLKQLSGLIKALFFSHSAFRTANICFRASCCCDFVTGEGTWAFLSITNGLSLRRMYSMHKAHFSFKCAVLISSREALSAHALWIASRNRSNFLVIQAGSSTVYLSSLEGRTLDTYLQNETGYFTILITMCILHHLLFLPWRLVPIPLHSLCCISVSPLISCNIFWQYFMLISCRLSSELES